jgi:hypothetical protein
MTKSFGIFTKMQTPQQLEEHEMFDFTMKFKRLLDKIDSEMDTKLLHTIVNNIYTNGNEQERFRHVKGRKIPDKVIDCLLALHFQSTVQKFGTSFRFLVGKFNIQSLITVTSTESKTGPNKPRFSGKDAELSRMKLKISRRGKSSD